MIIADTSGLLSAISSNEQDHAACAAVLAAETRVILSPFVLAETDYFSLKIIGVDAEADLLHDVVAGVYELADFDLDDLAEARHLILKYRHLRIGLADASIAVLAAKYDCYDVLTLDERHFRAMRPAPRKNFRILPADR